VHASGGGRGTIVPNTVQLEALAVAATVGTAVALDLLRRKKEALAIEWCMYFEQMNWMNKSKTNNDFQPAMALLNEGGGG
jgi:hypothetical protein